MRPAELFFLILSLSSWNAYIFTEKIMASRSSLSVTAALALQLTHHPYRLELLPDSFLNFSSTFKCARPDEYSSGSHFTSFIAFSSSSSNSSSYSSSIFWSSCISSELTESESLSEGT